MAHLVRNDDHFTVGKDFVDAVSSPKVCHGEWSFTIRPYGEQTCTWDSTLSIAETEHALRTAAKLSSKKVTKFISQNY